MYRHKLQQHQTKLETNRTTKTTQIQLPNTNPLTFAAQSDLRSYKIPQKCNLHLCIKENPWERIIKYVRKNIVVKSDNG